MDGSLRGFAKVTRDFSERHAAEETARRLAAETAARRAAQEAVAIRDEFLAACLPKPAGVDELLAVVSRVAGPVN